MVKSRLEFSEYTTWENIKQRCCNPNAPSYYRYGGRGITICDRWKASFGSFLEDMGPKPTLGHTIDRIDNDGAYCPENCRWVAEHSAQMRNSTAVRYLEYKGERLIMRDWANKLGLKENSIASRLRKGYSVERALAPVAFNIKHHCLNKAHKELGTFLIRRLNRWGASIYSNGKSRYLGSYLTREEAHAAYLRARGEISEEVAVTHSDDNLVGE